LSRMQTSPEQARQLLPRVNPGRVLGGLAVGLRDGAILALVAAGLNGAEIAALHAEAVRSFGGHLFIRTRDRGPWGAPLWAELDTALGSRLLSWLSERRIWATDEAVFAGQRGRLTRTGVCKVVARYASLDKSSIKRRRKR
jgi:hypothetical protein